MQIFDSLGNLAHAKNGRIKRVTVLYSTFTVLFEDGTTIKGSTYKDELFDQVEASVGKMIYYVTHPADGELDIIEVIPER